MKTKLLVFFVVVALVAVFAAPAFAGNGAPSGAHYNLNIIGVQNPKTADMTCSNGHVIFVDLIGKTKINLTEGDFAVLDKNGTDNDGAAFQLPNPDPDNDGVTTYSVYVRALGKPGKSATLTPGASYFDDESGTWVEVTSDLSVEASRGKGKQTFDNVSKELLYVYFDLDGDGLVERYPLFDEALAGYFWDYDNTGLKLLQMRFYEISTDTNIEEQ